MPLRTLLLLGLLASCSTGEPLSVPVTTVPVARVPNQADRCSDACDRLRVLGCSEGLPIDLARACKADADCTDILGRADARQQCSVAGQCMVSCVVVCRISERRGLWPRASCVAEIDSCEQFDECPQVTVTP